MQIESKYQIEKIVEEEHTTESLRYVHIAENQAIACNGLMLARVPCVTVKGDHLGPVTKDAMAYAREHTFLGVPTLFLLDGKTVLAADSSQMPRSLESVAVEKEEQLDMLRKDTDKVKPLTEMSLTAVPRQDFSDIVLRINPEMLLTLAKALGSKDSITLRMQPNEDNRVSRGVRVEASPEAFGVIMPIIIRDQDNDPNGKKKRDPNVTLEIGASGEIARAGVAPTEDHILAAIDIIQETNRASVSSIQRRLHIGYTLASQIMDELENRKIVGPAIGADPREVLIKVR